MKKAILLITYLLFIVIAAQSQKTNLEVNQTDIWSFNLGAGVTSYFGDLVNPGKFGRPGLNITVGAEYQWKPHLFLRSNLSYMRISGDDTKADDTRRERNLSFFSNNLELNGIVGYNFFEIPSDGYTKRNFFNAYVFGGPGLLYINPKATRANGQVVALQPLETEGIHYTRIQFVIPYGVGFRFKIDPQININLEGTYRTTFTDYLDDISKRFYRDPALLKSDLAREMSDRRKELDPNYPNRRARRGRPLDNDGYMTINLSVQYTLGKTFPSLKTK